MIAETYKVQTREFLWHTSMLLLLIVRDEKKEIEKEIRKRDIAM